MNRHIHFSCALGLLSALSTSCLLAADDDGIAPFQWSRATLDLIASGDPQRGEATAKKSKCKKCHGVTGVSDEEDTPSIAGQPASYNFKQLVNYKTDVRSERSMAKATKKLDLQDMADLAAFYATQEPEPAQGGREPPLLVTQGDMDRLLLPCNVCHGESGEGMGFEVPALRGQKRQHLIDTLGEFQSEDRENDHFGRMRFIAGQLDDDEIEAVAAWYAATPSEDEDE